MRVPKAILDAQEYRAEVIQDFVDVGDYAEDFDYEEEELDNFGPGDLELSASYQTIKERTNYALMQLYEQKGYDVFKKTCLQMKGNNWFNSQDYGTFKGESAEIYLYVTVLEFIKKFNLPWKAYLSLVIPHRDNIKGKTTELDLVLVSEQMITVFESKSYGGNKTIVDKCSIKRKTGTKDIFGQNAMHCESLIKLVKDFNITASKGMKSVLFSYAEGTLTDNRELKYRKLMPVVTEVNLLKYLTQLTKLEECYWKGTIFDKFEELSANLTMEDHMNYINSKK